jgi:hypothetical protein
LPGVLNRRTRRAATATAALVALISVSGCSAPAKLDQQEKVAFARACTSLIERNVAQAVPPVKELDNQRLDLNDPAAVPARTTSTTRRTLPAPPRTCSTLLASRRAPAASE